MHVYRLKPILSDPRFEGFGWDLPGITDKNGRTYDFAHFYPTSTAFKVPSLKKRWDDPSFTFQENVNPFNDFPCCDFHVPVFSRRATEALRQLLEPNGELLPVKSKFGLYYAYQTTTLASGVLDFRKSKGIRLDGNSDYFFDMSDYVFYKSKLRGLSIFRIIQHPSEILVTDIFRERIEANKLLGFNLEAVWADSNDFASASLEAKKKTFENAQAKTLVFQLQLAGNSPTKKERRSIEALREQLASTLVLKDPSEDYIGGLAGENLLDGRLELLMPCPNPKRLLKVVRSIFDGFNWGCERRVFGRNSPYWDVDATSDEL